MDTNYYWSWLWFSLYLIPLFLQEVISQPHHYVPANPKLSWTNKHSEADISSINFTGGSRVKTILHSQSSSSAYACGFFCDGNCDAYLFAIFSVYRPNVEPHVVWSANRNNPVKKNATLELSTLGLVLKDSDGTTTWSTSTTTGGGKSVAGLNMTDVGNLILLDHSGGVVWQSFDHPTDSLLNGQKLMAGKNLTSTTSPSNRTTGLFSVSVTNEGLFASIESNPRQIYYQFIYNGTDKSKKPSYVMYKNPVLGFYIPSSNTSEPDQMVPIQQHLTASPAHGYLRLDFDGHFRVYNEESPSNPPSSAVDDLLLWNLSYCDYPMACGNYGVCKHAECNCQTNTNIKNQMISLNKNKKQRTGYSSTTSVKGPNMPKKKKRPSLKLALGSSLGALFGLFISIGVVLVCRFRKKKELVDDDVEEENYLDQVPEFFKRFSFEDLKAMTQNFHNKLGAGGFGVVFEGVLTDGTKVAVKRLDGIGGITKSCFAVVVTIASIHHVNLVRMIGFCVENSQRFIVYEYMCNGSLDRWIFHKTNEFLLSWKQRKKIIVDIAKGLNCLHEDCRHKILHLDIKPDNILLDEHFNAKISDFGLCKLIEHNQSQVVTTMKGTPGYLAPEWSSSVITEKVDVYSFGIVMMEILCGRRNIDHSQTEEAIHLLPMFKKLCEANQISGLIDKCCEDMQSNEAEVVKMMKVAAWCLQSDYRIRPSMSMVVKVLEGVTDIEYSLGLDYNFSNSPLPSRRDSFNLNVTSALSSSVPSGPR